MTVLWDNLLLLNYNLYLDRTGDIIDNTILKMNNNIIFNKNNIETTLLAKYYDHNYIYTKYNNTGIHINHFSINP